MTKLIHVAAAAIFDDQDRVLLALRDKSQHQGGLWEFPGGKVEAGEPVIAALARELNEELGINIDQASVKPLIQVPYHYPDKSVLLDVFSVTAFTGEPFGREGQPIEWVSRTALEQYQFPAANKPILNSLLLPKSLAITPKLPVSEYQDYAEQAFANGAQWLMLRAKHLTDAEQAEVAAQLQHSFPGRIIWNSDVSQANDAVVDGLHLNSRRLMTLEDRSEFRGRWIGASCHNAEQLEHAVRLGLDYVTLSPVNHTQSHPNDIPMGWEQFKVLANSVPLPVYALGGVGLESLEEAIENGAQGVAGISGFGAGEA